MNLIPGAFQMRFDHLFEDRKEVHQCGLILGLGEILPYGLEIPEGCVHSVVLRLSTSIRKIVRQHPTINVASKCDQNLSRNTRSARRESKTGQSDHGVPAPIAEPVITRDDGSSVWLFRQTPFYDELVRRKNELLNPVRSGGSRLSIVAHPFRE